MKKLIIPLTILILMGGGCATTKKPCCPPEDAIIMLDVGIPAAIEKGFFDDRSNWMTEKEYDEIMEKYLNSKGEKI